MKTDIVTIWVNQQTGEERTERRMADLCKGDYAIVRIKDTFSVYHVPSGLAVRVFSTMPTIKERKAQAKQLMELMYLAPKMGKVETKIETTATGRTWTATPDPEWAEYARKAIGTVQPEFRNIFGSL